MKPITIISDPGIDDLIALLLIHKLSKKSKNNLITTFGNAPEKYTYKNGAVFLSLMKSRWNLISGSQLPLSRVLERPWPSYFHGIDGVCGIHTGIKLTKTKGAIVPNKINRIISLGPLTDLYRLFQGNSTKFSQITIMGGAFKEKGNETAYAETNIAFDPDSASLFFSKCFKCNVKLIPLDVTRKVYWKEEIIDKIPETSEINIWIKKIIKKWYKYYDHEREDYLNLHDPLAVYLTFNPEKCKWYKSGVKVILTADKRGKTEFSKINPKCKIAMELVDPKKIAEEIFMIAFK